MSGICFILGGVSIHSHDFSQFNFFESYMKTGSPQQEHLQPLNQHIFQNKIMLPHSFEPKVIRQKILARGPDCFVSSRIDMFKILS